MNATLFSLFQGFFICEIVSSLSNEFSSLSKKKGTYSLKQPNVLDSIRHDFPTEMALYQPRVIRPPKLNESLLDFVIFTKL